MTNRGGRNRYWERDAAKQTVLIRRAEQVIEVLMENNGFTPLTKSDFAGVMAQRFGSAWLQNGKPNRRLVDQVAGLSKDQFLPGNEGVHGRLRGFVIAYSPSIGGMTLIDETGEMSLAHMLHITAGDLLRQKNVITVHRRRLDVWNAIAKSAIANGDVDLGLLAGQIQREIEMTGFVSEAIASEFLQAVEAKGLA